MAAIDTVTARQGDTVDALIWRERGLSADLIGAVLDANPGIADLGAQLPLGTQIVVPRVSRAPATLPLIQLWD